jgi:hypothetical protein
LFEQLETFNVTNPSKHPQTHGRPKSYTYNSLIVLFLLLTLKGYHSFKVQQRWLKLHPQWGRCLNLQCVPSRATLSRRYKQLAVQLEAFIEYLGDAGMTLIDDASKEVVYQDKSLFKTKGAAWHQKDRNANHIPQAIRVLDTDVSWSRSKYHGWVYGYGLHLAVSPEGMLRMGLVDTACVSEKAGLDQQPDKLLERNIGYVVGDAGYTDLSRTERLAKEGPLLLTPVLGAKSDRAMRYVESVNQSTQLRHYQHKRKTAIELIFGLLGRLLSTRNNHKQVPVSGKANVSTFLM